MDRLQRALMRKPIEAGEGYIHYTQVVEIYKKAFNMDWFDLTWALFRGKIHLDNEWYKPADTELIKMIVEADLGDRQEWLLDWYDCGAFTFNLMGVFHQNRETAAMPIFVTWVDSGEGGHAVITYINELDMVKYVEPQTDYAWHIPPTWVLRLLCG